MLKFIKRLFMSVFAIIMLLVIRYDERIFPYYKIIDKDGIFGVYRDGNVYIGNINFLKKLKNTTEKDILIVDNRNMDDPTIKVLNSYKIVDNNTQNEILHIILEYEKKYPSNWNRTMRSLKKEWIAHNLLYYFDYQINRTVDVDFNNNDENAYSKDALKDTVKKIIKKILNRLK